MRRRSAVVIEDLPPKAQQAAKDLKEELDPSQPTSHIEFPSAHGKIQEEPLHGGYQKIVESIFVEDPFEKYKQLERKLQVGQEGRALHASVNAALDEAESNARLAHKLWMSAKVERDRWERQNAIVFSAMRTEATRALQSEKDQGKRNKTITDADVDNQAALMFQDEWLSQQNKRKRVEAMERSMENLNELWISRCRSLQAMLSKQR
jgi:hypothetical protein